MFAIKFSAATTTNIQFNCYVFCHHLKTTTIIKKKNNFKSLTKHFVQMSLQICLKKNNKKKTKNEIHTACVGLSLTIYS